MKYLISLALLLFCNNLVIVAQKIAAPGSFDVTSITPNQFKGTDTERIQKAIDKAAKANGVVYIPSRNTNGSYIWKIDKAILLPSNIRVMLDNCVIQLSDSCRDNMFRSNNVGEGITNPGRNKNIHIIGIGKVILKGANNPRSTGDAGRQLTLDPDKEIANNNWRVSYGSDAAFADRKQTGDWRNIMILMAQVDSFSLKNIRIENSHAWTVSFERTTNAELSDIELYNPEEISVKGRVVKVFNKDGIDLRQGCKNFRINNISGFTADDFIALSSLDVKKALNRTNGNLQSTMVTKSGWYGPQDDTEQIYITNIIAASICRSVAIRASDSAGIHHVYINGLMSKEAIGKGGRHNALLIGGKGYGDLSQPGKINNIFAMNINADGHAAVMIEALVADCHFMNILYSGKDPQTILYAMDKASMMNITETNIIKTKQ